MLNYEEAQKKLIIYVEECRHKIRNLKFNDKQIEEAISLQKALIRKKKIGNQAGVEDAIKFNRENYLNIKLEHTLRVVDGVTKIASRMHLDKDFIELLKCAALLHDLGRFDQCLWTDNFMDSTYSNKNSYNPYRKKQINSLIGEKKHITNHDRAGYYLLFEENMINNYDIDIKYHQAIGSVVYYHGDAFLPKNLDLDLTKYFLEGMPLALPNNIISSALLQIVRDADKVDILYQYTTSDFLVTREDFVYPINNHNIDIITKHFSLSAQEILDWNGITKEEFESKQKIRIPLANVDPNVLKISPDLKEKFFKREVLTLKELSKRHDHHFITTMWWRLGAFLNDINFIATLEEMQTEHLLDKIYNAYPDKYKPLVVEAFIFSKEKLINEVINNHKKSIYLKYPTKILT